MNIGARSVTTKVTHAVNQFYRPECGSTMTEVDRCSENEALYRWYQCGITNCDGQWLQKTPVGFISDLVSNEQKI